MGPSLHASSMCAGSGSVLGRHYSIASPDAAMAVYLLNPFSLLSSVAGTTTPLENLSVVAALHAACRGDLVLAALSAACGGYLGLHPLLLLVRPPESWIRPGPVCQCAWIQSWISQGRRLIRVHVSEGSSTRITSPHSGPHSHVVPHAGADSHAADSRARERAAAEGRCEWPSGDGAPEVICHSCWGKQGPIRRRRRAHSGISGHVVHAARCHNGRGIAGTRGGF